MTPWNTNTGAGTNPAPKAVSGASSSAGTIISEYPDPDHHPQQYPDDHDAPEGDLGCRSRTDLPRA